jgi:hypothetical protein
MVTVPQELAIISICVITAAVAVGCPALSDVEIPCESSLDCRTGYGCDTDKFCSKGVTESTLTVEPEGIKLSYLQSVTFTAMLDGQVVTNVTWSLSEDSRGTLDDSGHYTASNVDGDAKITAALMRHPALRASATAHISNGMIDPPDEKIPPDNTVPTNAFSITSPTSNTTVSGTIQIIGIAGSQWLNVASWATSGGSIDWSRKLTGDVAPTDHEFNLALNTTQLTNGTQWIVVRAFSVTAGQPGGTYTEINLSLNVAN